MLAPLLALVVAASPGPQPAASEATPIAISPAVSARLDERLSRLVGTMPGQTPVLGVAIAERGRVAYAKVFGAGDVRARFPIASVTKTLTAVAVMQLVERHLVELDATVATYLPSAPYARQITVRQLLQHTSGLWNYGDEVFRTGAAARPTTVQEIFALVASHPLTGRPGATYAYSNSGYVVLGQIVEEVTQMPLEAYERTHIFNVAGMPDTSIDAAAPNVVPGYMHADGPRAAAYDPSWLYAAGDLVSTASDVAAFDDALLGGKLVAPQTLLEMQTDAVATDVAGMRQGLGVELVSALGLRFIGHHGGVPGFETETEMLPASGLAIVVLSDAFDFFTFRANDAAIATLFPQFADGLQTAPAAGEPAVPEDTAVTRRFRETLDGLLHGRIDRSQFDDAVNAALTDDVLASTAAQLAPLGAIERVAYLDARAGTAGRRYRYGVTFANGTMTWVFGINAAGKITAIGSSG